MLPELMYQILLYSDIKDVKTYCNTTKYQKICYNKQFWIDKFNEDDLELPKDYIPETLSAWYELYNESTIYKEIGINLKNGFEYRLEYDYDEAVDYLEDSVVEGMTENIEKENLTFINIMSKYKLELYLEEEGEVIREYLPSIDIKDKISIIKSQILDFILTFPYKNIIREDNLITIV